MNPNAPALGTPTTGATLPDEATLAQRAQLLEEFFVGSRSAFLDAYYAAAPASVLEGGEVLLDLFLIEKAAYEICYEAANRPAWLEVPLRGLAQIVAGLLDGAQSGDLARQAAGNKGD